MRSQKHFGHRARFFERESVGNVHRRPCVGDGFLRISPARQQRHRPIAGPPAADASGDGDDLARAFQSQDRGGAGRGWVVPLALQKIGAIDRRGMDVNPDRALYEWWRIDFSNA